VSKVTQGHKIEQENLINIGSHKFITNAKQIKGPLNRSDLKLDQHAGPNSRADLGSSSKEENQEELRVARFPFEAEMFPAL